MQVKNNYDILWREEGGTASGMGMFNGDIGVIRTVDKEVVLVDFDGKLVEYTPDMLGELEPAFAVTVHKAQGSEYRAVILAALDGAPMLMTRGAAVHRHHPGQKPVHRGGRRWRGGPHGVQQPPGPAVLRSPCPPGGRAGGARRNRPPMKIHNR